MSSLAPPSSGRRPRPLLWGCVGSALVLIASLSGRWLPEESPYRTGVLRYLNFWLDKDFARVAICVGVGLLFVAWWQLASSPWRRRPGWVLACWSLPLLIAPPVMSPDSYLYASQGWLLLHGEHPYLTGMGQGGGPFATLMDPAWRGDTAPYPPLWLLVQSAMVFLGGYSQFVGPIMMRVPALLGVALIIRFLPPLARWVGVRPAHAIWFGALNPVVILHLVGGAHNDALMAGLAVLALRVALVRRWWGVLAAAALVGVAALIKQPAFALVLPVALVARAVMRDVDPVTAAQPTWLGGLRSFLRSIPVIAVSGIVGAVVFVVVSLAIGLLTKGPAFGWLPAADLPNKFGGVAPAGLAYTYIDQIGADIGHRLNQDRLKAALALASQVGLLVVAFVATLRWGVHRPLAVAGVTMVAAGLTGLAFFPWYLGWGLALVALGQWSPRVTRLFMGLAVVGCVFQLLHACLRMAAVTELAFSFLTAMIVLATLRHLFDDAWDDPRGLRGEPDETGQASPSALDRVAGRTAGRTGTA